MLIWLSNFYANLRIVERDMVTIVNNTHFTFDVREFNELMPNEGNEFCTSKFSSRIIDYDNLKRSYFGRPHGSNLTNYKMNYLTSSNRMLYYILVSILAPISGHKTYVTHIGLHVFYGILISIPINLGAFMIDICFCANKTLAKDFHIWENFNKTFSKENGASFDGIVDTRPSDGDRIDKDYFKILRLDSHGVDMVIQKD